jgi:acetolactate synthase-1/2/3 large subunit
MRRALPGGYELDDDPARIDVDYVFSYLSRESYWARGRAREVVERSIAGSLRVVGLYHGGAQVGFARVISDGAVFAYLADVFVDAVHRGHGLGVALVREIVDGGPHGELSWRLDTSDAQALYAKLGFRERVAPPSMMERAARRPPVTVEQRSRPVPPDAAGEPMTGGDAIVESLLRHGVDTVFALPGAQIYGLFDAFERAGRTLRVVCPRHEQAAAYMAFGYAKSTGRVGVYAVVPGPGVLNSSAALCSAYATSTAVVCLTGQVPSEFLGAGRGHLHELPDQLATLRTLTKWVRRIEHPAAAPTLVAEAFRQAASGRPRPVALEMPWEVFDQTEPVTLVGPHRRDVPAPVEPDALERAARLLERARNPMIMVGSGALDACREVLELAELLQAPVVSFRSGRGVVSSDHDLGFSCAEGFERWRETDVLIGIGSRLELQWFRWPDQPSALAIIDIDIESEQLARSGATVGLHGDAAPTTAALTLLLREARLERPSRSTEFAALKAAKHGQIREVQPHVEFLAAIRDVLPRDGFFVEELCQAGFASYFAFPVYEPRTFVTCGAQGTLGFGFPTALGVKAGNPDRAVVSITGDGGFQFGLQELATAAQYGLDLVTVLFNNGAYGNVMRDQTRLYGGRVLGAALANPDFVALAGSYGIHAVRTDTPAGLRLALEQALERSEPALIEVPVDPAAERSPWEFLMPPPRAAALPAAAGRSRAGRLAQP